MGKAKAVWGIDVGQCALKALKLIESPEGDIEIVAQDYIEHAKILSQPDADPPELIAKSLEKFLSRNDISEDDVVIGVPGQHTLARFSKLPPVDEKKIPDIVQFEANQQIPFDMDEVIWDYQTFGEEDSPEIEVGIFAMKRELIHEHLAHFSDVGIEPIVVQSAPLSAFDAMMFDGQCSDETTVLVDIGAENTDLVITDGSRIWTRTISIGGNNFTDALASGFKLSFSKAENLKRQASSSKYARQIFQAMRPIFEELVSEIQRSIGFYTSTHRDSKLDLMIGMGNAFRLPGLQKYLQQNLDLKVHRPSEFKSAEASASIKQDLEKQILSFCVAYGLALEGLGKATMQNNLLPPEIARQAVWRKKKPWFGVAAACLLLCSGLVWYRQTADINALNEGKGSGAGSMSLASATSFLNSAILSSAKPREVAEKTLKMSETFKKEHNAKKSEGKTEQEDTELLLELQENKQVWPQILSAIHRAVPGRAEQFVSAGSPEGVIKALLNDESLERSNRSEIYIDSFQSRYTNNVFASDYRDGAVQESRELFDYYDKQGAPGFVITLNCTTPNKGKGQYIQGKGGFVQSLRESGQQADQGFFLDGIRLIRGSARGGQVARSSSAAPAPASPFGAQPPQGLRPGDRSPGAAQPPAFGNRGGSKASGDVRGRDPLTLEEVAEDWRFELMFVVVLDDLPEKATPGSPTSKGGRKSGGKSGGRGRGRDGR